MPTLAELRPRVLDQLGVDSFALIPYGNDLEQWLTFLSVDQPWFTDVENLSNRVMFLRASTAVSDCIREIEQEVVETPFPTWLTRLVASLCADSPTVVTFNYDVLVESVLTSLGLVAEWADVYRVPLASRQPGASAGLSFRETNPPGPTLELLRLHGSTNHQECILFKRWPSRSVAPGCSIASPCINGHDHRLFVSGDRPCDQT